MKNTLSINSLEPVEISYSDLASVINALGDEPCYADSFSALASHPASEVRCAVAMKTCLPLKTLVKLSHDKSIEVVRDVTLNETALNSFDESQFQEMVDRDVSVAACLADNLFMVSDDKLDGLINLLLQHPDPRVAETADEFNTSRQAD